MAEKASPPHKQSFAQEQFSFFIGAWTALNYTTGFAATLAAIPIDLGIDAVRAARWIGGHRNPQDPNAEPLGCFPLTGEIGHHMREVGRTIDLVAILGLMTYGSFRLAINAQTNTPPPQPTPLVWDSGIPYTPTPLPTPSSTPIPLTPAPLPLQGCITVGENGVNTAFKAWKKLGKPNAVIFQNLAGPDANGQLNPPPISAANLPAIVHNGDKFCPDP